MQTNTPHRAHKINCLDVAQHVQRELDLQLASPRHRPIRAHLRICPNCSAYLDSLKEVIQLYRRVPSPHISKQAKEKLFAALGLHHETREIGARG